MLLSVSGGRLEHMFETVAVAEELRSELARLRVDGRDRRLGQLVDLVGTCQSAINQLAAVQTLAMAHVAAIEDVALEDGTIVEQHRGLGHQRLDAPALVSDQLGVSDAVACSRVGAAVDLVTRLPEVVAAMGDGRLDEYRARIVSDELREAPAEVCAEVGARIADSLGTEAPAVLRRRVRRVLGSVDADLLRAKAARARSERCLSRWPGDEPGVDTWLGSFPAEQSRSGWAVVDGLARQYVRHGRATRLEQARADALMDLIHARASGTFLVQLAVPADQLSAMTHPAPAPTQPEPIRPANALPAAGRTSADETTGSVPARALENDELVTVAGLGMSGTTQVRQSWLTTLAEAGESALDPATRAAPAAPVARWEVVVCHAETGALLAVTREQPVRPGQSGSPGRSGRARGTASKAYRPPQSLVDLVKARDGRCRFPGCTISARFCDLDHVTPWPTGPTDAANLICLCRRHHRIKQTVRWRVRIDPDATVTWTDPTGRVRSTLPMDFLQHDTRQPTWACGREGPLGVESAATRDTRDASIPTHGLAWRAVVSVGGSCHELARSTGRRGRQRTGGFRSDRPVPHQDVTFGLGEYEYDLGPAFHGHVGHVVGVTSVQLRTSHHSEPG